MKTETDLDVIVRELVEWKDGWEIQETNVMPMIHRDGEMALALSQLRESLDLVRELEGTVVSEYPDRYHLYLMKEIDEKLFEKWCVLDGAMADPEPRLRALHRTLREGREI